ncbi:gntR family regulatory protein, partial [Haemophilus influenzae]
LKNLV